MGGLIGHWVVVATTMQNKLQMWLPTQRPFAPLTDKACQRPPSPGCTKGLRAPRQTLVFRFQMPNKPPSSAVADQPGNQPGSQPAYQQAGTQKFFLVGKTPGQFFGPKGPGFLTLKSKFSCSIRPTFLLRNVCFREVSGDCFCSIKHVFLFYEAEFSCSIRPSFLLRVLFFLTKSSATYLAL